MLPRTILSRKAHWVWIAMIALSPLAYLAGSLLLFRYDPNMKVGFTVDRQTAVESAARYAATKGIDVSGWSSLLRISTNDNLLFYYRLRNGNEREVARRMAPEATIDIRFKSPDRLENLEVELGPDGRPLGYSRIFSKQQEVGSIAEPAARQLAAEAIKARLAQQGISANVDLKLDESAEDGALIRKYTWKWPLSSLPELTVSSQLSFRGGMMTRDSVRASVESQFAQTKLHSKSTAKKVTTIAYVLLIAVVLIFSLYRFTQRVKQKEISFSRVALVTLIFASVMSLYTLLTDVAVYDVSAQQDISVPDWMLSLIITFSAMMSYFVIGLFMGLAYGSGEGDIRESYPGKLTSLDALITGKLFSQNVWRSLLIGCAMGGWILLLSNTGLLPWQGKAGFGEDFGRFDPWFGLFPWLSPVMVGPMHVILVTVIGILIPLPFLHRKFRSQRLIVALSAGFVWLASAGPYLDFRPWGAILIVAAVDALVILLTFFSSDLLAVIVCMAAPSFWKNSLELIAQPSPELRLAGIVAFSLAAASILAAIIFYFKGRLYREDEVRPVYAKHLAERISMQAEVSAAREAQKRLMPERLPSLSNVSVAACFHPAHEVGGDFYDVFELEPDKLGVLIAEGGGKGLGSALSIAFAKGYLMPKILGNGLTDNSPTEVIRGLQDRLQEMLEGEAGVGLAYAVIDAGDGTLRYSRIGPHPLILIANEKSPGKLTVPEEREIKFKSSRAAGRNNRGVDDRPADISVIEGRCVLGKGDSVAMLTDGILKNWVSGKTTPEAELAKVMAVVPGDNPLAMQEALDRSVVDCAKRARKNEIDDDLTVVVIKLARDNAPTEEGGDQ